MKKVCLFTGASGRLGTTFCQLYADKYHIVAVYNRRYPSVPTQRRQMVDPLEPGVPLEDDKRVYAIQGDVTQEKDMVRVIELALARYDRIDLLVHAAVHSVWGPLLENDRVLNSMESQFKTNVMVPARLTTLVARMFWKDDYQGNVKHNRNVVNVSSTAGLGIYPGGQSIYSASKAALNYLTCHMANEMRSIGVRVNATAPTSFPQIVTTEGAARTIVRLDEGDMTGKILVLDRDGERFTN